MVVEIPRWTNAKMEVILWLGCLNFISISSSLLNLKVTLTLISSSTVLSVVAQEPIQPETCETNSILRMVYFSVLL